MTTNFQYNKLFEEYYRQWFSNMSLESMLTYEEQLSAFIDSDFFSDFVLADEVSLLYEIMRDECVKRCQLSIGFTASGKLPHAVC